MKVETVHEWFCGWWAVRFVRNSGRRSAASAAHCAFARSFSSGVARESPRGLLTNGLPMAKGGLSHALAPGRAVLREGGPLNEGERKIGAFYSSGSLLHSV